MKIRRFEQKDADEVSQVICTTLKISNSKDYSPKELEIFLTELTPEKLWERALQGHFYVVCDGEKIVGCGDISPFWGSKTESILLTIFVLPEYQGKGIGRQIIQTLEQDEYALRAERIEIPASKSGVDFYRKLGYDYKNGIKELENGVLFRLEKFRRTT